MHTGFGSALKTIGADMVLVIIKRSERSPLCIASSLTGAGRLCRIAVGVGDTEVLRFLPAPWEGTRGPPPKLTNWR